jgi:hypothetical protein
MAERFAPAPPFAEITLDKNRVTAVLAHDPAADGLDVGIYLDCSAPLRDEYKPDKPLRRDFPTQRGILGRLFGWTRPDAPVETEARRILQNLASKDRNGKLRLCYWSDGVQYFGEVKVSEAKKYVMPHAQRMAGMTFLAPVVRDFMSYLKKRTQDGARRGMAVVLTDGKIQDMDQVEEISDEVVSWVRGGQLPRTKFLLVGCGKDVDPQQLERICSKEHRGIGHLWRYKIAGDWQELAETVAVKVDKSNMVAAGATLYDDKNEVIRVYEGRLPSQLDFELPPGAKSFALEVEGRMYTQRLTAAVAPADMATSMRIRLV